MIAVHEPDTMERRAWLSTEAREALAGISALDAHEARQPMVAHDDAVFRALVSDDSTWENAEAADTPMEDDSTSTMPFDAGVPATDRMLAQYFREVRRFALLSFAEEQALGRRIKRWQRRVRWALYTSPMALPTLRRLWHQSEPQDISRHEVVQDPTVSTLAQTALRAQSRQAILSSAGSGHTAGVVRKRIAGLLDEQHRHGRGAPSRAFPPVARVVDDVRNPAVASPHP